MNKIYYRLPGDLAQDIENHASDVSRFLSGDISPAVFKARRVPRGIYEQRKSGTYMVRVRLAGGRIGSEQARVLADVSRTFGNCLLYTSDAADE